MSDYTPDPRGPLPPGGSYDKYGNSLYEPPEPNGRGPYVLLAILAVIGLVGGLLYFNGPPREDEVARAPDRIVTAPAQTASPASPAMPAPTPAAPAAPAAPTDTAPARQ